MAQCKNKGCTGLTRKGQFFCYDCYMAWLQGGDDAVAARIAEMTKHTVELAELRAFKERVFDAVLPAFPGATPRHVSRTEKALFDVIHSGHYVLSKLRKEWYNSPDFGQQGVPKNGPNVRAERAKLMVEWYRTQLGKANKPKPIVLGGFQVYGNRVNSQPARPNCSDCGTPCGEVTVIAAAPRPEVKCGAQCWALVGFPCVPVKVCTHQRQASKHPSAKQVDEAEPLRLKVAQLEGRLSLYRRREAKQGTVTCFSVVIATVAVLTGIVAYFTK